MSGSKKCPGCQKTVYFAEKVSGINDDWWHKLCFKCADSRCGVALKPGGFQDHDGKLYCKRCYAANFSHSGYGYGGSGGTLASFGDKAFGGGESSLSTN